MGKKFSKYSQENIASSAIKIKYVVIVNERDLQDGGGVRRGDHLPPTNTSEIHLHVEQLLQNTYWTLAEDLRLP